MRWHRRFFTSSPLQQRSSLLSWKPTGKLQQTVASPITITGTTLHSGNTSTINLLPSEANQGRFFISNNTKIPASIHFVTDTTLCTTLSTNHASARVRTVEHLLSALEATGVDNCRIEIHGADEVPILDGSAREWVEAIEGVGLCVARDSNGTSVHKLAAFLNRPLAVSINDSFMAALPSPHLQITCGIHFPQVPQIGCQWFSSLGMDNFSYTKEIASARTFCIHEQVEQMYNAGFIQGGSTQNAIVCSAKKGWLNPPLRFKDEPCRHKVLDLVGDLSLFAQNGNQGLPVAHIIAYKGGHSLHAKFVLELSGVC